MVMTKHKKMFVVSLVLFLLFTIMMLIGCEKEKSKSTKPIIAVTIVPQKTLVEIVGGDAVEVVVMVPPASSPANHEPHPMDIQKLHDASIYFCIGVSTEATNIHPLIDDIAGLRIVEMQEEVAEIYPEISLESGSRDPHIWLSPKRVMVMLDLIAEHLSKLMPDQATQFIKNAQAYRKELEILDERLNEILVGVQGQSFIVFHPAFGYLAYDYGLVMLSLERDGKPATAKQLQSMVDVAKKEEIRAVFYQEEISSRQADSFAEEIGGQTFKLAPLSPNYLENMEKMADLLAEVIGDE